MKRITLSLFVIFAFAIWQGKAQINSFPYSEDFESGNLPTGWVKEIADASNDITITSSENHTPGGQYAVRFSSYYSSSDYNQYLFTDTIHVTAPYTKITFYVKKYNNSDESLQWGISTTSQTSSAVSSWTDITLSTSWQQVTVDLSAYDGQTIFFAWHYYGDYLYYVYLDDVNISNYSNPVFTLTEQPDCANSQYSVDVNITDLGGAGSVTVTDDQGSASQQLTAPGTVTFGPYADGTDVTFTVTNDDDGNYSTTDHIQYYCPPDNDDCANAIALTIGASCSPITADNLGATDSGVAALSCANYQGGDVWFTVTPSTTDTLIVETSSVSGSDLHDTGMAIYTGDCTNLTQVACDDDGGNGAFSKITVNTPTANATYYVRVWEYGNNSFGEFGICAYQPQLGVNTLTSDEFSFYPNPTNGVISWKANGTVDRIQILNLTGQVLAQVSQPAANRMDISRLPKGVYMLQVQMGDRTGTYRLIKE